MNINQAGLDLLKQFEGCRLDVYKDVKGLLTVGVGHRCPDMALGDQITQEQADAFLKQDVAWAEKAVTAAVKVPLSSNEFSALVCLVFNIGSGAFGSSLLLRCLNTHHREDAAAEFLKWNHAGGRVVDGLTRRRQAERALFLKP